MPARKYSASMDDELLDDVERAARAEGVTVSAWLAEAARDRVRLLTLQQVIDEWEEEHGAFTEEEIQKAEEWYATSSTPEEVLAEHRPSSRRRSA